MTRCRVRTSSVRGEPTGSGQVAERLADPVRGGWKINPVSVSRPCLTGLAVFVAAVCLFGGCLLGGSFPADPTCGADTLNFATLLDRTASYVREGSFPLMFPEFEAGYPVAATWMYGLQSPSILLYLVLPVDVAWGWSAVIQLVFAGVGMHLLARSLFGNEVGAATAAILYALSEFTVGRIVGGQQNIVWAAAWVPWACWAGRRALAGRPGGIGALGLTLGLGLISGHVQLWFYAGPALLVLSFIGFCTSGGGRRGLLALAAGGVLAVGIASVQWLFTLEHVLFVGRPDMSYSPEWMFSTPPHGLAEKLFPGFLGLEPGGELIQGFWVHESFALAGGGALLLVGLGLILKSSHRWWLASILLAGLLLAPGPWNSVSETLNRLPLISLGRTPGRGLFLAVLAGSLLGGGAVSAWLASGRGASRGRLLAALLLVLLAAAVAAHSLGGWAASRPEPARIWSEFGWDAVIRSLSSLAVATVALLAVRRRPRAQAALPLAVLVAVLVSGVPAFTTMPSTSYFRDWFADLPADAREHRMHLLGTPQMPNPERLGGRTLRSMANAASPHFRQLVEALGPTEEWQYWFDIRYGLTGIPGDVLRDANARPRARIEFAREPVGHARLFTRADVGMPDDSVLRLMAAGTRGLHLAGEGPRERNSGPFAGTVGPVRELQAGSPNRMEFEVTSDVGGWLFVSVQFHPLWTARVNDRPAPIRRANVGFMAVEIPAGESRVSFRFRSRLAPIGAGLSAVLTLFAAFLVCRGWRRRPGIREDADDSDSSGAHRRSAGAPDSTLTSATSPNAQSRGDATG
jgi:Bacterial membrane protein YfhO